MPGPVKIEMSKKRIVFVVIEVLLVIYLLVTHLLGLSSKELYGCGYDVSLQSVIVGNADGGQPTGEPLPPPNTPQPPAPATTPQQPTHNLNMLPAESVIGWVDGVRTVQQILTNGAAEMRTQATRYQAQGSHLAYRVQLLTEAAQNVDDLVGYLERPGNERPIGTIRARLTNIERNLQLAQMHESYQGFAYLSGYVNQQVTADRNVDVLTQVPPQPAE